jgi:Na+-transporting methylmalonyl-CoA/oxaloacetate decarboxylase gamma subunit
VETENLTQGLQIVGVGVGGVFVNLLALMLALYGIGLVFGKKKKKKRAGPAEKRAPEAREKAE